jgi:hypothetical protein
LSGVSLNDVHSHGAAQLSRANPEGYSDLRGEEGDDETALNEESSRYVIE